VAPPPAASCPVAAPHSGSEVRRGWPAESSAVGDCGLESGCSADAASDELLRPVRVQPRYVDWSANTADGGRPSARGTPSRVPGSELPPAPPPPTNSPYTRSHSVVCLFFPFTFATEVKEINLQ